MTYCGTFGLGFLLLTMRSVRGTISSMARKYLVGCLLDLEGVGVSPGTIESAFS